MYFTLIGHTHEKPDQLFSVISKRLLGMHGRCILTPVAMEHFVKTVVSDADLIGYKIYDVRQVSYCYDFVSAIKPYLNKEVKNYIVSRLIIDIVDFTVIYVSYF